MKFSYALIKKLLPRVPTKQKLAEALNTHSFEVESVVGDTLDIKLPANLYSYAASHIGVAREAALIFKLPFKSPVKTIVNPPSGRGLVTVEVKEPKLCRRQAVRYFDVKKLRSSPEWMKKALISCGMRSVDAVVDITNYIAVETGEPIHAFDADTLEDKAKGKGKVIIVRRAKKGEKMKTLDGKTFSLTPDMLVLADPVKALDIAGIKGGVHTGVSRTTKHIVLIASNFDSVNIYRTSRALGLVTDASVRFSHDISPELVGWAMDRATELLTGAGATLLDSADWYPKPQGDAVTPFDPRRYEALIGIPVTLMDAEQTFARLGFLTTRKGGTLLVRVPAWRNDIENAEDLIEEVCRIQGLGELEPHAPLVSVIPATQADTVLLKEQVRSLLVQFAIDEVYSDSFVGDHEEKSHDRTLSLFGRDVRSAEVENPIASDKKYLRSSLIPILATRTRENARFYDTVRIFEVGAVFAEVGGTISEKLAVGIILAGKRDKKLIFEAKGMVSALLEGLGIQDHSFVVMGQGVRIESDHRVLGFLFPLRLAKGWYAAWAELDLEKIMGLVQSERAFAPLPRYPSVIRDISLAVSAEVRVGDVLEAISGADAALIEDVDLVDEYTDASLGGKSSFTFRVMFQADDRTLTDEEVDEVMGGIAKLLQTKFRASVR